MESKNEENSIQTKKVAIVTGGSRGIGSAIVKKLALNNYNVILNYNTSYNEATLIANEFENVKIFKADVSNPNDVKNLISFAINTFGKIDLLVNNAGIDLIKPINDMSIEEFDKIIKTNLYSAFYTSKNVCDLMIHQKSGCILNISSIWGIIGSSCEMAYSVSKAGMDAMTKSLAKEFGPSNIRVNSIAPGFIDTDMNSEINIQEKDSILDNIPLGRIGTPSEIADCALYLANAEYITGQVIQVNGGWNI